MFYIVITQFVLSNKKSPTLAGDGDYSMSEKIMEQRIEKNKFSDYIKSVYGYFLLFWTVFFLTVPFLRGCADEQHVNELKAKENMYVRVQVEGVK